MDWIFPLSFLSIGLYRIGLPLIMLNMVSDLQYTCLQYSAFTKLSKSESPGHGHFYRAKLYWTIHFDNIVSYGIQTQILMSTGYPAIMSHKVLDNLAQPCGCLQPLRLRKAETSIGHPGSNIRASSSVVVSQAHLERGQRRCLYTQW